MNFNNKNVKYLMKNLNSACLYYVICLPIKTKDLRNAHKANETIEDSRRHKYFNQMLQIIKILIIIFSSSFF